MNFNNANVSGSQSIINAPLNYNTITLKPNVIDNRNVFTQKMINEKHTKYIIKWDYILEGAAINIPQDYIYVIYPADSKFMFNLIMNGFLVPMEPVDVTIIQDYYILKSVNQYDGNFNKTI